MEAPGRCGIRSIGDAPDRKRNAALSAKAEFQTHLRCRTAGHTTPPPGQTLSPRPFRVGVCAISLVAL
jgi:hypothetical protein